MCFFRLKLGQTSIKYNVHFPIIFISIFILLSAVMRPKRPQQLGPYYINIGKVSGSPAQQGLLTSSSGILNQDKSIPFAILYFPKI